MPSESRTLTLPSGELPFGVCGAGPLVILSHALGAAAWGDVERLAARCTVVVPEWLDATIDLTARLELSWMAPLVGAQGHERATLVAWSMAAPGAIEYATEEPDELARLVLVDPAGITDVPGVGLRIAFHSLLSRLRGKPTRGLLRALVRDWIRSPAVDTGPLEQALARFMRQPIGPPPGRGPDDDEEDEDEPALVDQLQDITVPTLFVAGRHSSVCGSDGAELAEDRLRDGRTLVFEDSAHGPQLEEPERFADRVAEHAAGRPG